MSESVDAEQLMHDLKQAGARLHAADQERDAALEQLQAAVVAAHGTVSVSKIADLSGVTRVTAYRLLEKAQKAQKAAEVGERLSQATSSERSPRPRNRARGR